MVELIGKNKPETIVGKDGEDDVITGGGGHDKIFAYQGDTSPGVKHHRDDGPTLDPSAGNPSDHDVVWGGAGNDQLHAGAGAVTFLYEGAKNGYDIFFNGTGISLVLAETSGTIIGIDGYANGVDEFQGHGSGDTIIQDNNQSNQLDFRNTALNDKIAEVDAGSGNDTIYASDISDMQIRGGTGNDKLVGGGDLDVFAANFSGEIRGERNQAWLNDGFGNFSEGYQGSEKSRTVGSALGDLDGDGDLDFFEAVYDGRPDQVWLNDGAGNFTLHQAGLGNASSWMMTLGDIDGDNDLDAIVAHDGGSQIWKNNGNGIFQGAGRLGSAAGRDVALGDLDSDGDLDVFVGVDGGNEVWLNNGSGTFTRYQSGLGNNLSRGVALGDLDGDGDLDAFVANQNFVAEQVWINDGTGAFSAGQGGLGALPGNSVALGDIDSDGDLDAVVANARTGGTPSKVWKNDGSAQFSEYDSLGNMISNDVMLGDIDRDGDLDAFFGNSGGNQVWLNNGSGDFSEGDGDLGMVATHSVGLDDLDGGDGIETTFLYSGTSNGFDTFINGAGTSIALAETSGTVIGVNGYNSGVDVFMGHSSGDTVIRDSNASRALNFKDTNLARIAEINAAGGDDSVTTSALGHGVTRTEYDGANGQDHITIAIKTVEYNALSQDTKDAIDGYLASPIGATLNDPALDFSLTSFESGDLFLIA